MTSTTLSQEGVSREYLEASILEAPPDTTDSSNNKDVPEENDSADAAIQSDITDAPARSSVKIDRSADPSDEVRLSATSPLRRASRKLLILDLNGTLCYRKKSNLKYGYLRPHCKEFLEFAFNKFYVMIWSSARRHNVIPIMQEMLSEEVLSKITALWCRDNFKLSNEDYYAPIRTFKNLELVWTDASIAKQTGKVDQFNTVIVDDSEYKVKLHPFNHICIPEFTHKVEKEGNDHVLKDLELFLIDLDKSENVSNFLSKHIYWKDLVDPALLEEQRKIAATKGKHRASKEALNVKYDEDDDISDTEKELAP